jgi:hypothetical protein
LVEAMFVVSFFCSSILFVFFDFLFVELQPASRQAGL